jgi:hypothetical protein
MEKTPKGKQSAPKAAQTSDLKARPTGDAPNSQPAEGDGAQSRWARVKPVAFYGGIVLLGVLALVAWKQPLRPRGDYPAATFAGALNWFFYPYEVNPWYRPPAPRFDILSITAIPGTNGQAAVALVGDILRDRDGQTLRTTDGGKHWHVQRDLPAGFSALTVAAFDQQHLWIAGYNKSSRSPQLLNSNDGGRSWTVMAQSSSVMAKSSSVTAKSSKEPPEVPVRGIQIINSKSASGISDSRSVSVTQDGGATWKTLPLSGRFTAAAFHDADFYTGCTASQDPPASPDGAANQDRIECFDWQRSASPSIQRLPDRMLYGITFQSAGEGWAVGERGGVFHTLDGGTTWARQQAGTAETLTAISFADAHIGWIVGSGNTILHTTDGGTTWTAQESTPYRRYPAPWFFLAMVLLFWLLAWATTPQRMLKALVDDVVSSDAPVESLEDDRLGQRALIERLTNFLTNPNTLPPLVISLQAPWGMGKSSVMRMLEANLKKNRAAVTVWFNAWHHQKEDQLLAYLLETVQRQALPQWLSGTGLSFRLDLLRVRLFDKARRDRLALVLAAILFVALRIGMPELFPHEGWGTWLTKAGYVAVAGVFLRLMTAFKSNPEKLTENAGGFLVDTFKEAVRLPSLVGKSDVRQEFAENLKDVAEALKPQRLVIFLDDLDRCRPEQVVQILEAINFLSSVAPVFVIMGADYAKVETLVANQFADLALKEAENARGKTDADTKELDEVRLRVEFARNYLRKIVNVRLNLKALKSHDLKEMMDRPRTVETEAGMFARYGRVLATLAAPVLVVAVVVLWMARANTAKPQALAPGAEAPVTAIASEANLNALTGPAKDNRGDGLELAKPIGETFNRGSAMPTLENGRVLRNGLLIGIPVLLGLLGLIARLARPANLEEAEDDPRFKTALVNRTNAIFKICRSPREVRRLLNYLRLVAARSGQPETDQGQLLRDAYGNFDELLVGLAVQDKKAPGEAPLEIRRYYEEQCAIFGLEPKTFQPKENSESGAPGAGHEGSTSATRGPESDGPSSQKGTVPQTIGAK